MEKVLYSLNRGRGLILDENDNPDDIFDPVPVKVVDEVINPGNVTDMSGFLEIKYKYAGLLKGTDNCMCFYMASAKDLFNSYHYYTCWYLIHERRIFNMFTEISGRDWNYINGLWK